MTAVTRVFNFALAFNADKRRTGSIEKATSI